MPEHRSDCPFAPPLRAGSPAPEEEIATKPADPGDQRFLPKGTVLGRYILIERVGAGGMGVVYAAYDPELNRRVALKLLRTRDGRARTERRTRLLREAQTMARLAHPHVVTVFDVGTWNDDIFVAMEFIEGQSLRGWAQSERRTWKEILAVFLKAGAGLAAAHREGIVHRDFKPDNVLIGTDGRVRVSDFGLARSLATASDMSQPSSAPATTKLTRTGAVAGTPAYMPPEQITGGVVDERSDVFSFCVALYECLYGHRPFAGASLNELHSAILAHEVSPAESGAAVPAWLRRVLLRGLSPDPADRFPTMDALLDAIQRTRLRRRRR
jgi:serine/threonine protein kinase